MPQLSLDIIEELFPFSFSLAPDLALSRVTPRLARLVPSALKGRSFEEIFTISRPVITPSQEAIASHSNDIFVIAPRERPEITLRGQFLCRDLPEIGAIMMFVGGPWITRLSQLSDFGLQINDFPPHDPRGDFLVLLQTQWTNLDDMRALTEQLRTTAKALEARTREMESEMERRASLERQLRQSQKMEALGRLAGGVAHDFNNILLAIDGYAALALAALPDISPASSSVKLIRTASDRAAALTKQLLAFTRQTPLQPTAIDITKEIHELEPLLTPLMKGRVTISIDAPPGLGYAWADPTAVQQIVMNLAINAFDAMPNGGELFITVKIPADSPGRSLSPSGFIELSVRDTGTGMDQSTMSKIFEPFFSTKGPGKGTGLGLSTVHGLVEQCGGSIEVESALNQGAVFRVLLPRVDKAEIPAAQAVSTPNQSASQQRVLLVEDDPMVRHLLTQILMTGGYHVSASGLPEEALALIQSGLEIDLIVTDVQMPTMSGPELVRRAEGMRGDIPTVFVSGHTLDPMFRGGKLPPHYRFLRKPFPPLDLLKEVRAVLKGAAH